MDTNSGLIDENPESQKMAGFRDLKSENKRTRKEPLKPWGIKERLFVLITLLLTVLTSGALALSARNFKLPNIPKMSLNVSEINPFREQVVVLENTGSKISMQKIENIKKKFKEATDGYSGIYSFYIYDINGGYHYGENYQEVMQAASLIKLPVIIAAYEEFEAGRLDRTKYTPLIEAMGKRSDNSAFREMVSVLGKDRVNKEINKLGMPNTSLEENTTTPEEMGLLLKKLYLNDLLNEKDTQELLGFLTDTIFESWLRPGIPNEYKLAHKYGREVHVVNDAGIVLSDRPVVIVIMTDGIIEKEADELFPKLTKLLYDYHIDEKTN